MTFSFWRRTKEEVVKGKVFRDALKLLPACLLKFNEYPVQSIINKPEIGHALKALLQEKSYGQVGLLADTHTYALCYPGVKKSLPPHTVVKVPAGEKYKTLDTCITIWKRLTKLGFDRHSVLVVLGGGVLGDMGGFCAATYKRGIDFILVPTTLLAQVDASVGGKLGIDFMGLKNHVGIFQQPRATLISSRFLKTLPQRELRSGFAEVIKHCLVSSADQWDNIRQRDFASQPWDDLIEFSVQFKSGIAHTDQQETGIRKILNFGHTVGHALESYFLGSRKPLLHGEAIAIGMIVEAHIALQKNMLSRQNLEEIKDYILSQYGKHKLPAINQVMKLVAHDKKNREAKILMALIESIGHAQWDVEVVESEIGQGLEYYRSC